MSRSPAWARASCRTSVKAFTQAGGALDLRVQTKIREWAAQRGGQFFVMYGQTEASPRMATLQHADHARKAGSVGVALAGGQFSIVDENGAPLPADAVGTVVYEGPNVMLGYAMSQGRPRQGRRDERAASRPATLDGWMRRGFFT